ncbi:pseudaminic acid cytidylyltransferase [Helicobacter sp. 12S02232-10]|uniref:pseudaminic acid cytidylyltransferase n=1 Tax=Helicobacter sp. 12S02232-10 TaxID=1476197 RepID=UPI000BA519FF|nr:pseudaminic acid cytidylyltransferase [Helicobacter sp. 12S02232-10]PAF47188.1 pseudaminic acid cytidylyltransferase [Helicobacter sp. 12S02232-10]
MKKIAVIPARGGSKRIPKKNIRLFCGQPILAYSIQNAIQSGAFDEIIVSTDDEEIAEIARSHNAKIPFIRPKHLALDTTPTLPVIAHAIETLGISKDDLVCCIYPTAPLLEPKYIILGLEKLMENPHKLYAFSCVNFDYTPWRGFLIDNEKISMLFPQHSLTRSQDLSKIYHDAGAFYWGRASAFCEGKMIFESHSLGIVLPKMSVQDIDTPDDWEIAEIKYKLKHSR